MFRCPRLVVAAIFWSAASCGLASGVALAGAPDGTGIPAPAWDPTAAWSESSTTARATHCGPEADGLYEEAFDMLALGERLEASARLGRVRALCPSHPFAAELQRLAEAATEPVRSQFRAAPREGEPDADGAEDTAALERRLEIAASGEMPPETASLIARGELVAAQTIHGLAEGLLVCAAASCTDARVAVGLGLAGVAVGGGASFFLSDGLRPGQALAVNSGMGWGLWNAIAFANVIDAEDENAAGLVIAGGLVGTAAGTAIAVFGRPRSGQVSLANSGGLWAGVLATWLMDFAEIELFQKTFFEVQLAASGVGLGAGALLSRAFPVSRGRVLLIDAGGLAGTLLGVGTAVLIDSEPSARLVGGLAFVGTLAGLASVSYFTRSLDDPDDAPASLALLPMGPRGTYGASVALTF